jgi:hypothetical protein
LPGMTRNSDAANVRKKPCIRSPPPTSDEDDWLRIHAGRSATDSRGPVDAGVRRLSRRHVLIRPAG